MKGKELMDRFSLINALIDKREQDGSIICKRDHPLSSASTFAVGGAAKLFVLPKNVDAFCEVVAACEKTNTYYLVIGKGSNVLFDDLGFDGVVICTTLMDGIKIDNQTVTVDCGASVTHLASVVAKSSLSGLEFAYGIPGTLGGAVFMNAGAYGGEFKDVIVSVQWYDTKTGKVGEYSSADCQFDYRSSVFQSENKIILSAKLLLNEGCEDTIREVMNGYMAARREKQPLEYPSAGSTFKRYPGYFTAKLIDDAGLKGYSVGGAQVSEKHAGFVINKSGATSLEIKELISVIKKVIYDKNGIEIECEVRIIPYKR